MACRQAVVLLLLFTVVARIPVASAGQPSFDCAKASSWAEVTVCNDEGLSDLDRRLAELYRSNRAALTGEQQKNLIRNQRNWLRERESCAKRPDRSGCLVDAYKARIAQLGGEPESSPRDGAPASSANGGVTVTTVNGKTVWYGPSSQGTAFVEFQTETKGYTNTYILDCENKRFLWAKNVLLATGQDTGNSAGAEWKQLNPESTLSNAVYEAACPQQIASVRGKEGAPAEARDTKTANGDPWDHRSGLEEPEALAEPSHNVAPKVASSVNVDNAAARVDLVADKRSTGTGDEHTVPETQGIEVEPSKLVLPPARSTDVVDGGTPLAATGHMVTMPGGDAELQGVARRPDRISMKDGSMLSGNIGEGKVPFKSSLGEIEVRLEDVLAFADGKLHLADGTVLAGAFADAAIEIAASFGTLKVPAGEIVAIVREGQNESGGESTNRRAGDTQHPRGDPFQKQVYRAVDDEQVITLFSKDELELSQNGTNFVCKYSKEGDALRIQLNHMGTTQAIYYRITPKGLLAPDQTILHERSEYERVMKMINEERRQSQLNDSLANAAQLGDITAINDLIAQGAQIDGRGQSKSTPLMAAINARRLTSVAALLELQADPNITNYDNDTTPLMLAARLNGGQKSHENARIIQMLIDHGANLNAQDDRGYTALILSVLSRNQQATQILVKAGANRSLRNSEGKTACDYTKQRAALRTTEEAKLLEQSRTETKVIGTFRDVDQGMGRPTREGAILTDVSVYWHQEGVQDALMYFSDLQEAPKIGSFRQTAFGWDGYTVILTRDDEGDDPRRVIPRSFVFLNAGERDAFYNALVKALDEWSSKFQKEKMLKAGCLEVIPEKNGAAFKFPVNEQTASPPTP